VVRDLVRDPGERAAEIDQPVDREHADATPVGQDDEALARKRLLAPQGFGCRKGLVEIKHTQ
jgi:hypothetical protein